MALWSSPAPDPRFQESGPITLEKLYPAGKEVVLTAGKYKGCVGKVVKVEAGEEKKTDDGSEAKKGEDKLHLRVDIIPPEPPFGLAIVKSVKESYVGALDAAKILKMPIRCARTSTSEASEKRCQY